VPQEIAAQEAVVSAERAELKKLEAGPRRQELIQAQSAANSASNTSATAARRTKRSPPRAGRQAGGGTVSEDTRCSKKRSRIPGMPINPAQAVGKSKRFPATTCRFPGAPS